MNRQMMGSSKKGFLLSFARAKYKEVTGVEFSIKDAASRIDALIAKVKAAYSLATDVVEVLTAIKKGFYGLDFTISDSKIKKAIEVLKHMVTLSNMTQEDKNEFEFWADLLTNILDSRKQGSRVSYR